MVFRAVFAPVKSALVARLKTAHQAGEVRPEFRADVLADLFGGMIFTGAIRRSSPDVKLDYSASAYRQAAVDLVLRGATIRLEGQSP
jgi:hypothetical protein